MSTSQPHAQPATREVSARREKALAKKGFSWDHWKFVPPEVVPCAICEVDDAEPLYEANLSPGPIVRCRRCGLVYASPVEIRGLNFSDDDLATMERLRESSDLADLEGSWEHTWLQISLDERETLDRNYAATLDRIAEHATPPGRLLDFGAGWGFFLSAARDRGWDVSGIEPTPGHALYAREELGLDVRPEYLREDTFEPESFDVVTSLQVFEHVDEPLAELAKIHRVLKPGGLLVMEIPSIDSPLVRIMRSRHRHFVPDHFWYFDRTTLPAFVQKGGFDVIDYLNPTRRLSLLWLTRTIGKHYTPAAVNDRVEKTIERSDRLTRAEIPINVRDLGLVIARKPPA